MCSLHTVRAAGYLSLKYADSRPAALYTRKPRPRRKNHRKDGNRLWKPLRFPSNGRVYPETPSTGANITERTGIGSENPGIPVQRPCIHGNPVHGRKNHGKDGNRLWKLPGFPSNGRVYMEFPSGSLVYIANIRR